MEEVNSATCGKRKINLLRLIFRLPQIDFRFGAQFFPILNSLYTSCL
ncbi:hypothetical protein HMPREF9441_00945 [Paraprevotella clara YIT 11840]|uniref:Uncharacterized protein n=1 Tax=Paraprevotella clara YIT 11840 TaxID=762968 RepID=G5SNL6_9BACT|nr:hypothetical protein HMPREF9441_00945 [Paraprevotella clara YIT 11840]